MRRYIRARIHRVNERDPATSDLGAKARRDERDELCLELFGGDRILGIATWEVGGSAELAPVCKLDDDARRPCRRILRREILGNVHVCARQERRDRRVTYAFRSESIRRE